jgi:hypothetical protein
MAEIHIDAGGVEIKLVSDADAGATLTPEMGFLLWQKVYDQLLLKEPRSRTRAKPVSGTGFMAERAEPIPPGGEGGPSVGPRSEAGRKAAQALGMSPSGKPGCFHPWPGCNC